MVPTSRTSKLIIDVASDLRAAVEAEARQQSQTKYRKVTMSDVIRDLIVDHLISKNLGVSS